MLQTILDIALRTAAVYLFILVGLRVSGKREIGQITIFDLVVLMLIANAVQNAMVGSDTSLVGGIAAGVVLLILNFVVAQLRMRSRRLRHIVEGTPTLLIHNGKLLQANLQREALDEDILHAALRQHELLSYEDVEIAVLEVDGSISIVPKGGRTLRAHGRKRNHVGG
jgi:uncharacterized membrane protein YcaP (DUF421 family)